MSYNIMIGYDIYDCFTMEHFRLRQRMTLTTKTYCSRLYIFVDKLTLDESKEVSCRFSFYFFFFSTFKKMRLH
jgi:hypothetical protein